MDFIYKYKYEDENDKVKIESNCKALRNIDYYNIDMIIATWDTSQIREGQLILESKQRNL